MCMFPLKCSKVQVPKNLLYFSKNTWLLFTHDHNTVCMSTPFADMWVPSAAAQINWCVNNFFLTMVTNVLSYPFLFAVLGMQPPLPPDAVRELVCSCLHRDPVAADLRCSLFVAAAQSYKRDSLLRPFPPRYISGDNKEFEELVRNLNSGFCILTVGMAWLHLLWCSGGAKFKNLILQ